MGVLALQSSMWSIGSMAIGPRTYRKVQGLQLVIFRPFFKQKIWPFFLAAWALLPSPALCPGACWGCSRRDWALAILGCRGSGFSEGFDLEDSVVGSGIKDSALPVNCCW